MRYFVLDLVNPTEQCIRLFIDLNITHLSKLGRPRREDGNHALARAVFFGANQSNNDADDGPHSPLNDDVKNFSAMCTPGSLARIVGPAGFVVTVAA
jgi:hypothetical protein